MKAWKYYYSKEGYPAYLFQLMLLI